MWCGGSWGLSAPFLLGLPVFLGPMNGAWIQSWQAQHVKGGGGGGGIPDMGLMAGGDKSLLYGGSVLATSHRALEVDLEDA